MPANGELNLGLAWAARHWARYRPDHLAIESELASLTYRQLDDLALHVAMYLLDSGIAAQRPVGLLARDASVLFPMALGTLRAGAQIVILDPALSSAAMAQACEATGIDALLVDHAARDVAFRGRRITWDTVVEDRRGAARDHQAPLPWFRPANALWGAIVGAERGGSVQVVRRSDLAMLMEMTSWALELDIRSSTICYTGHALSQIGGFIVPATTLLVGGTVLAPRAHGVDRYRVSCERHDVQIAHLRTEQVQELLGWATYTDIRPRARTVVITGAAVPTSLKQGVREVLGSQVVTAWHDEDHLATIATPRDLALHPTTIGRPLLADSVVVVDSQGEPVPRGTIGRLATPASSDDAHGGIQSSPPGDLTISESRGFIDESGYVYLVTAASDGKLLPA